MTVSAHEGVWRELVGQESATALLQSAATDESAMTHSWLITGPPGSGRSNAARAFAAALQCPEGGCGTCHICTTVLSGTHPDVTVLATDKVTISIEEVRNLIQVAARTPGEGHWRVIIVEDADRMLERTTNVLLKAIEEPPPRTVWLLCAPSPQDVLVTIRSRCRHVVLRVPPVDDVAALIAARDGIDLDRARAAAAAAQSHIGMARRLARDDDVWRRRAHVLALVARVRGVGDAVVAAGELVETAQTEAAASSGERDAAERTALLVSLGAAEATTLAPHVRSQIRQLEEEQKRRARRRQLDVIDQALLDLLGLYRDVLVVQLQADVELINTSIPQDVQILATGSNATQTLRRIDAIGQARTRLAGNVTPLLAVEAMMVELRPR